MENYSEWRLVYFISFLLLVGFFVLNMFVGVVVENFHKCRQDQEKEERERRTAKRKHKMEQKRKSENKMETGIGVWHMHCCRFILRGRIHKIQEWNLFKF